MTDKRTGRWASFKAWIALPRVRIISGWVTAALAMVFFSVACSVDTSYVDPVADAEVSVTGMLSDVRAGKVDHAVINESTSQLTVTYEDGETPVDLSAEEVAKLREDARVVQEVQEAGDAEAPAVDTEQVPLTASVRLPHAYEATVIATLDEHHVPLTVSEAGGTAATGPGTYEGGYAAGAGATTPETDTPAAPVEDTETDAATESGSSSYPEGGATSAPPAPQVKNAGLAAAMWATFILLAVVAVSLLISGYRRRRQENETLAEPAEAGPGTRGPRGKQAAPTVEPAEVPDTRFADVAGCDEAITELQELVMFLKDPDRFTRTGAKPPKGALLAGPPGTGKTLLARAVAGESGVPFYSAAGSDFVEMYVGVGAKRVRELFAAAKKEEGGSILFIDEIDAVARKRGGADAMGNNSETENTLIALLAEMDGFEASNVIVLAATNRSDILDPAITRPGRLDRKVEVPNPDRRGREKILAVHTAGKPIADDVDFLHLARRTPGFSGAQLASLVNEACLDAVRRDLDEVDAECFDHAVATIAMGRARTSALVTDHDREVTAWHEAGHTLAAYLQRVADDPVQVTIVPRGPAGGVTWMSGSDDIFLPKKKAHARLVTALAGRAGEEALLGGEYTSGASGDLQSATELATAMATQYGMTRLGYQVRNPNATPAAAVEVVEELLEAAHRAATALLGEHRDFLEQVSVKLLDVETLTLAEVDEIARACGIDRDTNPIDVELELRTDRAEDPAEKVDQRTPLVAVPDPAPAGAVAAVALDAGTAGTQARPPSVKAATSDLLRALGAGTRRPFTRRRSRPRGR